MNNSTLLKKKCNSETPKGNLKRKIKTQHHCHLINQEAETPAVKQTSCTFTYRPKGYRREIANYVVFNSASFGRQINFCYKLNFLNHFLQVTQLIFNGDFCFQQQLQLFVLLNYRYCVFLLQENPEFDLHFEKIYKWVASSTAEKNAFISCIWKLNQRYLRKKIDFVNVSSQLLEGTVK